MTIADVAEPSREGVKTCSKCKVEQPRTAFYTDRATRDGLYPQCRVCAVKGRSAAYYQKRNDPAFKAKQREYESRPHRAARARAIQAELRKKYPEKHKARIALNNAVKRGKMKRGDCQVCGVPNAHAHHTDYSKPFDVEWYCRACHADAHRAERGTPATGMRRTG